MGIKTGSRLKKLLSRVFHIRFWMDIERIKSFAQFVKNLFKKLFVLQPQAPTQSFEEAQVRLQLTDEQLLKRQQALFRICLLMIFLALVLCCYGVYQLFYGTVVAALLTLVVILIALSLAFRYHFWYFQIKQRKLGCSWRDWLSEGLLGGKKT